MSFLRLVGGNNSAFQGSCELSKLDDAACVRSSNRKAYNIKSPAYITPGAAFAMNWRNTKCNFLGQTRETQSEVNDTKTQTTLSRDRSDEYTGVRRRRGPRTAIAAPRKDAVTCSRLITDDWHDPAPLFLRPSPGETILISFTSRGLVHACCFLPRSTHFLRHCNLILAPPTSTFQTRHLSARFRYFSATDFATTHGVQTECPGTKLHGTKCHCGVWNKM